MTGKQFKAIREELCASQRTMARVLDVEQSTIWRWESGRTPIPRLVELAMPEVRIRWRYYSEISA